MEENSPIRVAVVGAAGRMGREVLKALTPAGGFEIVCAVDRTEIGKSVRELVGPEGPELVIEDKLGSAIERSSPQVLVDFSHHSAAPSHVESAAKRACSYVIGCTGLSGDELRELKRISEEYSVPGMYVPNFGMGGVLMMKFAEMAAKWLPDVEIIEMHHDRKEDAPSGTALLTAEMIAHARTTAPSRKPEGITKIEGARGAVLQNVHIHSVRLPGLLAHQQVIFGGKGEILTLRHDSLDRASFMEGVKLCVRRVRDLKGLTVGLDKLLF